VAALVAGVLFVAVNYVGAKETGRLQNVIVVLLVAILTVFSVLGFLSADLSTLTPVAPKGYGAILPGTALIFVSFLGFAKITTVAEEIKNPGRNLPLAVVGSVVIVTIMYAIIMVVLMGVVNWQELAASSSPVIDVAEVAFGNTLGLSILGFGLITFAGLLATASSANASILASSRINFAMGRDKLVSDRLNEIHPKFATPYRSIAVTGGFIIAFILVGNVKVLAKAGSVLHLIVYGLMNLALIVMRRADVPEYDPDFEVPLYPATPILGAVLSFGLIGFMEPVEIALAVGFVVFGILWYALYARRKTDKRGVLSQHLLSNAEEVPDAAVSAASAVQPDGGDFRVMVPLANPEREKDLVSLASSIAKANDGTVDVVHVVTVPDQTPLESGAAHVDELDAEGERLLERAREDAETLGVPVETHTILSHRGFEEVFDAAREHEADTMIMGWGPHAEDGRAEGTIDEVTMDVPCDILVLRDRGFDPSKVLVPTAGGPDSDLSAATARTLMAQHDADVTLLNVVSEDETRAEAEQFLAEWAEEHGLGDAGRRIEAEESVADAIEVVATDHTLVLVGATERGLMTRLVSGGSPVLQVADNVDCSVLLAEKGRERSLWGRLLGR
jgi:nucleotide-binding universal stress UspA family protein